MLDMLPAAEEDAGLRVTSGEQAEPPESFWSQTLRLLTRDRAAKAGFALVIVVVACCGPLAPAYAQYVAKRGPNTVGLSATVRDGGRVVDVVDSIGRPIGPGWRGGRFLLGADTLGRDVLVRLLYGGRSSLIVGASSAALAVGLALLVALVAGYYGGSVQGILRVGLEILWAFPVYLLAIAISSALVAGGLSLGVFRIQSGGLLLPILIIGTVTVPYVARPLLAEVRSLRTREFIAASIVEGRSPVSIMRLDLFPNILPYAIVFFTLLFANNMIIEAALSFLGVGVQPPTPSWGNMIQDGSLSIASAPWVALAPGIALFAATLGANMVGDRLRGVLHADVSTLRIGGRR